MSSTPLNKRFSGIYALTLLALLAPPRLTAGVVAADAFLIGEYAGNFPVDGQNGGSGWTPWTVTAGVAVVSASAGLVYQTPALGRIGVADGTNACILVTSTNGIGGRAIRYFASSSENAIAVANTLWIRVLLLPPPAPSSGQVACHIDTAVDNESGIHILWEQLPVGESPTVLLVTNQTTKAGASAELPPFSHIGADSPFANLLLVKMFCNRTAGAADSISCWLNPEVDGEGNLGPPNAHIGTVDIMDSGHLGIRVLQLRATAPESGQACAFDEIALGTELADVIVRDSDLDGLPDDWEEMNGGKAVLAGGSSDYDGDGHTDHEEWQAQTRPADSQSILATTGLEDAPTAVTATWTSVTNLFYAVRYADRLDASDLWRPLAAGIPSTPPANHHTMNTALHKRMFMRVEVDHRRQDWLTDQAGGEFAWYREMNLPRGVYVAGKTYVCFHGGAPHFLDPYIVAYDHRLNTYQGPIKVGDSALAVHGDDHGSPVVNVDKAGHLHVIYGGHAFWGPMHHAVSVRPLDITAWVHLTNINAYATYPTLLKSNDDSLYYFYRRGDHRAPWVYVVSEDNGLTFSQEHVLMSAGTLRTNQVYYESNYYDSWYGSFFQGADDTIHYITTYHACGDDGAAYYHIERRVNIYYMRMRADGAWLNSAGEVLQLPIDLSQAETKCRIWESPVKRGVGQVNASYVAGFATDSVGNPRISLKYGLGEWGSRQELGRRILVGTLGAAAFLDKPAPVTGSLAIESNALTIYGNDVYRSIDQGDIWTHVTTIRSAGFDDATLLNDFHPDAMVLGTEPRPYPDKDAVKVFLWGANGLLKGP